MPEPVDHVRELGKDHWVQFGVGLHHEDVDIRLDLPRELLKDEVLVLHLGGEARCLEDSLAVPGQCLDLGCAGP